MELNKYILEKAKLAGICKPWAEQIATATSVDELMEMYVKGIDFCLEKDFPSSPDLVRLAGDKLHEYGIYVDQTGLALKNSKFAVLLGTCGADLHYDHFSVGQVFVKHNSCANVKTSDNSFLVIDCFDTARLTVTAYGNSKVLINVYGQAKVTTNKVSNGIIKIVHKNKSTY